MGTAVDRLVQAHPEGEKNADRDWYIHVGPAPADDPPGRPKKDAARIDERRKRNQGRQPMEDVARRGIGTGPDRNRKHHDVTRGEAGDGKRAHQSSQEIVLLLGADVVKVRFIAGGFQHVDERRRVVATPADRDALGRKIDSSLLDAGKQAEGPFDLLNAAAAVDRRYGQIALPQSLAENTAREKHFALRALRLGHRTSEVAVSHATDPSTHRILRGCREEWINRVARSASTAELRDRHARFRDPAPEIPRSSPEGRLPG